jgi:hypothetical protein
MAMTFDYSKAIDKDFGNYTVHNGGILTTPFWTKEFCSEVVDWCRKNKDKFRIDKTSYQTEELWFYTFDLELIQAISNHYRDYLIPSLKSIWPDVDNGTLLGIQSPYILTYNMNSIKKGMLQHTDGSWWSLYLKLNSDYEGGHLHFPDQEFSSEVVPVGTAMIWGWPKPAKYPHYAEDITSGEKFVFLCFNYGADYNEGDYYGAGRTTF